MPFNPDAKAASMPFAGKGSTRDGYGAALEALGGENPNIVALSADLAESTRVHKFAAKYPERFVQCGVAEQNMAQVAAGLSFGGKIAFMSSFAAFSPGRNFDQLRVAVGYSNANVKVASTHAGLTVGEDGATHQAMEDVSMMRAVPGFTIFSPCDVVEAAKATRAAAALNGPVYLRLGREGLPTITTAETPFEVGKAVEVWSSNGKPQLIILSTGIETPQAVLAAVELEKQGVLVRVIHFGTIKPIDEAAIIKAAKECALLLTVEEHQVNGGFGSAVAEVVSEKAPGARVVRHGVYDAWGESGKGMELLAKYGLDAKGVTAKAQSVLNG